MALERYRNYVSREIHKNVGITVVAKGLTHDEEQQIRALIRSISRRRNHEKRQKLIYDITFRA